MIYYEVSILNSPLSPLTYKSSQRLEIGRLVTATLQNREVTALVLRETQEPDFKCIEINQVKDEVYPKEYLKIFEFISSYYICSIGEAVGVFTAVGECERDEVLVDTKIELNSLQKGAVDFIKDHQISLLFGDTGSGKSEIYMKLIEDCINQGKCAIFLMPEISLTPQMRDRLKEKFGDLIEVWHSKISKKKKEQILKNIKNGTIRIIAGARSALFVQMPSLGLIIVDEEHDESYKSSNRPRYHARDLALYMGKVLGAKVVLGSATPSLTSYHKYPVYRLKGTYHKSKKSYLFIDSNEEIDERIFAHIEESIQRKKQVIVFLPTRANFKYLHCFECGSFVECPYCSVGMSLHLERNALICHYCHYIERIPKSCPSCKKEDMRVSRIGTAEVVKQLQERFVQANIGKFDTDEIKTQNQLKKAIDSFNKKEIDILVGTQMLSKGHNYLNVDLAVVLGIDTLLSHGDYRASERAVSLLVQIAGRSGRKGEGRVVIASKNEEFFKPYLEDFELFLKDEIRHREGLYPPFKRLSRVLIADRSKERAKEVLLSVGNCIESVEGVEVIGAGESPIAKIANRFRFSILIRSEKLKPMLNALHRCKNRSCEIDVDPVNFS
jgi:primosomal protein N' (replication factor Y)